jgi:hypothetical protein
VDIFPARDYTAHIFSAVGTGIMDHTSNQIAVASIKGPGTGATLTTRLASRSAKPALSARLRRTAEGLKRSPATAS